VPQSFLKMKLFAAVLGFAVAVSASMPADRKAEYVSQLSRSNSLQPEWHEAPQEGNGLVGLSYVSGNENSDDSMHLNDAGANMDANKEKFHGGTSDTKDLFDTSLGAFDEDNVNINMTPYVIQTKDERWEAGVPNFEAPENGYLIQTFDVEADARNWVIEKTGADNTINYPLAPDVDAEFNQPNPANPDDVNPNTMQDNAPTKAPKRQMGHMEPAYVGEYSDEEIFGDTHSDEVGGTASGEDHGDLQKAIYLSLKERRTRANRN
jgi:hypothetical protein